MKPLLKNSTVLLTGASSGIGREMARLLAPTAKTLILVARREERLRELEKELSGKAEILIYACDLTDRESLDRMLSEIPPVEVLINNAGMGDLELFEQSEWEKIEKMIEINITSLTYLTRKLVTPMIQNRQGGILNVSSGYGLTFAPLAAAYGGTKHYVSAFTDALRIELSGTGVFVSQLCPGPVETEFLDVAGNPTGRPLPPIIQISAEQCARAGLIGLARGKAIIIPGLVMGILINLGRITPRPLLRLAYSWIGKTFRKGQKK